MEHQLKNLLIDELHDLLSAEIQIVKALPAIVKATESHDLKEAFRNHLKETKGHVQRLEKAFKILKVEKKIKFCKAMKGLIDEGKDVLKAFKTKSFIRDAALISKAQRIEHYEISAYGTARTFATEIGLDAVAALLQDTLDEEGNADKTLTKIAEGGLLTSGVNYKADIAKEKSNTKMKTKKTSRSKKTAKR